ncbi:MAG TPA: hypothetical protein VMW29_01015 [Candidatus Bathyarchaeia archaeon]|nr:hypothetical protein [Candidatus Bathyarchaeia archaeon]
MKKVLFLIVSIVILGLVFAGCGDIFNVTLPTGGSNLSRSNGGGDIIYGIERITGDVYSVDVATCTATFEFTVSAPPTGSAKPNGLAYDESTGRFYYCDYQPTTKLYFWNGVTETVAGTIYSKNIGSSGVANGDFYNGTYYFIDGQTDDLYGVILKADGTIASGNTAADKLADIAGGAHGWTFDGDIGVQDGVIYGWGKCVTHGKFEFFTYDLGTGDFSLFTPTYQYSLQLAFGTGGTLYGHRSAGSGGIYEIDTTNGDVTGPICSPGVLFTDCASGSTIFIEEEPGIEVVKECPPEFAFVGETLTYNYNVENTGYGALLDVTLVDDQLGTITLSNLTDEDGDTYLDDLAWGASATGTANYVVLKGDTVLVNTATASSTSEIDDSTVEDISDECIVEICYKETAFGGATPGLGKAWWFYFIGTGTQTIWAGKNYDAGEVTVSGCDGGEVTITIELAEGWYLQDDDESVKIQGYAVVPSTRQPAGLFETYKGNELVVTVGCFANYVIQLDVQHCGEFE